MAHAPSDEQIARFRRDFELIVGADFVGAIGVAVSGGPDSLALLLLAQSAYPGRVSAATVDHGLRAESAAEARFVSGVAASLAVPHAILAARWPDDPPTTGVQEAAREARYAALVDWCADQGIGSLLTAHHADDQAETLLMRLGRGAGLPGLAGIRAMQPMGGISLIRPLLNWSRRELAALCDAAGLEPVADPSNTDPRHERSRVRKLLGASGGIDAAKVSLSAAHLQEVEQAMAWVAAEAVRSRCEAAAGGITFDPDGLPREIKRRALALMLARLGAEPRGSAVARAVDRLDSGSAVTLGEYRVLAGPKWLIRAAPSRRSH